MSYTLRHVQKFNTSRNLKCTEPFTANRFVYSLQNPVLIESDMVVQFTFLSTKAVTFAIVGLDG